MTQKRAFLAALTFILIGIVAYHCSSETVNRPDIPPECTLSVTSLDFGDVGVGASGDLIFTISNTGGSLLTGTVTSPCGDFTVAKNEFYNLSAGQSLPVTIRFTPAATGSANCTIATGSDDCSTVTVSGNGDGRCCSVEPETIDFRGVEQSAHKDTVLVITNCGLESISGSVSLSCNHYSLLSGEGTWSLDPGESDTVAVRFEPEQAGEWTCDINLGNDRCPTVSCIGESGAVSCYVAPNIVDFDSVAIGTFAETTITLQNTGDILLEGRIAEACDDFGVELGLIYALTPQESNDVVIRFAPQSEGLKQCFFLTNTSTVTASGSDACSDIIVSGTGYSVTPVCALSRTSLDFGSVPVGASITRQFTITNTGGGILSGNVHSPCGNFALTHNGTYSLFRGQSFAVTIRFTPTVAGSASCPIETGNSICVDVDCYGSGVGGR